MSSQVREHCLSLLAINHTGEPLPHTSLLLAASAEGAARGEGRKQETDASGVCAAGLDPSWTTVWVLAHKPGYSPALQAVAADMHGVAVVPLRPLHRVTVQVFDVARRLVGGAALTLRGRWGAEAAMCARGAPSVLASHLCQQRETDAAGEASFAVDADEPYTLAVSAVGFLAVERPLPQLEVRSGRVEVALERLVVAGIPVPTYTDGSLVRTYYCIARPAGLAPAKRGMASAVAQLLDARFALSDGIVNWQVYVEKDHAGYPAKQTVSVVTDESSWPYDAVFRYVEDITELPRPWQSLSGAGRGTATVMFDDLPDGREGPLARWGLARKGTRGACRRSSIPPTRALTGFTRSACPKANTR